MRGPAFLAALALSSAALAEPLAVPSRLPDGAMALARTGQIVELARTTREISAGGQSRASDMRVALAVLENGPASGLSPAHDLHLVLYNAVEDYGTAWAVEPVASVSRFERVARSAPGLYEIVAVLADPAGAGNGCHYRRALLTIDARALSVVVRHAAGLDEAETRRYAEPVAVTVDPMDCAR